MSFCGLGLLGKSSVRDAESAALQLSPALAGAAFCVGLAGGTCWKWLGMLLASAGDACAVVSADRSSKARGGAKPCAN